MHYFIRYDKKTGEVVGYTRSTTKDITPRPRFDGEGIIEITSAPMIKELEAFKPMASRLTGRVQGNDIHRLKIEPKYSGRIALAASVPDLDGDGMPELPADGVSTMRVTAQVVDHEGNALKPKGTRVSFRVTRGSLSSRAMEVVNGRAEVDWKSPTETVQARITASAEGYQEATLTVELIPPNDYRALSSEGKSKGKK